MRWNNAYLSTAAILGSSLADVRPVSGLPEFGSDTVLHFLLHKDAFPVVEIHKRLDNDQGNAASILVKNLHLECYRIGGIVTCRIIRSVCVCVIRDNSIITESCFRDWGEGEISLFGEL